MDTRPSSTTGRLGLALAVALVVVAVDQLTKWWATSTLDGRPPVRVIGSVIQLRLFHNSGAAFSIGSGSTWIFTVFSAAAVVLIIWFARQPSTRLRGITLGLLLGGALTHLGDRLFRQPGFGRGEVVDFIDYNGWFVGNVADIALVLGAAVLIGQSLVGARGKP
jgi:signal peptidase II